MALWTSLTLRQKTAMVRTIGLSFPHMEKTKVIQPKERKKNKQTVEYT